MLIYFDLLMAFKREECPVCFLVEKGAKRHLDSLYWESVNDPGVRAQLRKSRGFCNWHAWLSADLRDYNTGIAIIYKDLIDREIDGIRKTAHALERRKWKGPLRFILKPAGKLELLKKFSEKPNPCPICELNATFTGYYLKELVERVGEREFQNGFRNSRGLCLSHLRMLVGRYPEHPNLPLLLEIQAEKMQELSWELGELWRKCDYRFRDEPRGSESDSWIRALEQFVGKRGVFSNDISDQFWKTSGQSRLERFTYMIGAFFDRPSGNRQAPRFGTTVRACLERLSACLFRRKRPAKQR